MFELEIAEVIKETNDTISVSLNVPAQLKSDFNYKPGQYLTFESVINGEKLRRSYSLCSNPFSDDLHKVAIKRVEGGRFSNFANDEFKAGDTVSVMAPQGNFVAEIAPYNAKKYVLCAAGSGITPIMSILKAALSQEANSSVVLVYANSNSDQVIFKDELAALEAAESRLEVVYHYSNEKGRIDANHFTDYLKSNVDANQSAAYFMCGPQGFMEMIEATVSGLGVSADRIHKEYFKAKEKDETAVAVDEEVSEEVIDREVTVVVDGTEKTFTVAADETILEAAIDQDMDPPYSCQAGVCTTCRAMCVSGKVKMDEMEGLSEEEIEEGYVLACQAHPLTEGVKLEFTL